MFKFGTDERIDENLLRLFESFFFSFDKATALCSVINRDDNISDFIIIQTNRAFQHLTEISDVVGKNLSTTIGKVNNPEFRMFDFVSEALNKGFSAKSQNYFPQLGHWIDLSAYAIDEKHFAIVMDVITEKRLFEEKRMQEQRMEGAQVLAGGVAHDFNNLLSVIINYADFAMTALREADPVRSDILEIDRAGRQAAALVRQLSTFTCKSVIVPTIFSLNDVIRDMQDMLNRLLGDAVHLTIKLDSNLGKIEADVGQIEQIIMNLASNARDSMPFGGELTISTSNELLDSLYTAMHPGVPPGKFICLSMSDNGMGLNEEEKKHIFEPFFSDKSGKKGSRLAMSIVYSVVNHSGGIISVNSELGAGTEYRIFLPRISDQTRRTESRMASFLVEGNETILLLEENRAVRKLIERTLKNAGYMVLSASNKNEAQTLCEQHKGCFSLIITDIKPFEEQDALSIDCLSRIAPNVGMLFTAGYLDNNSDSFRHEISNINYLEKPFSAPELLRKVRETIDMQRFGFDS